MGMYFRSCCFFSLFLHVGIRASSSFAVKVLSSFDFSSLARTYRKSEKGIEIILYL